MTKTIVNKKRQRRIPASWNFWMCLLFAIYYGSVHHWGVTLCFLVIATLEYVIGRQESKRMITSIATGGNSLQISRLSGELETIPLGSVIRWRLHRWRVSILYRDKGDVATCDIPRIDLDKASWLELVSFVRCPVALDRLLAAPPIPVEVECSQSIPDQSKSLWDNRPWWLGGDRRRKAPVTPPVMEWP